MAVSGTSSSRRTSIGRLENYYPSPFFDVAGQYAPKSVKATFDWCLFYQMSHPIISAITSKLATYPITDLIYGDDNEGVNKKVRTQFEDVFGMRVFLVENNLDRSTFGNGFTTVAFPIRKMVTCRGCKTVVPVKRAAYTWRDFNFNLKCKSCGMEAPAIVKDVHVKQPSRIKLIRWNPKNITMNRNEITGETRYYYSISNQLRNSIIMGKPHVIETIPQNFINAVKHKKVVEIAPDRIFHSRRPGPSRDDADAAWGAPLILPVLKDVFFMQILKKSQEAIALEHIVPMRVLFPQVAADGSSPYANINLTKWQDEIMGQIAKWRRDPNHMPVMPLPMGVQSVGGDGKAMLLHQEIRIYSEQIISGLGVPVGFFYGDSMYSGASVNLRALENEFMGNRDDMLKLVNFIRDQVCNFMGWEKPKLTFKDFKMADDLQRSAFNLQLVEQGIKTKEDFAQAEGINYAADASVRKREAGQDREDLVELTKGQATANGEAGVIAAKYQVKAQEAMGPMGQPPGGEVGPDGQPVDPQQQQQQQQGQEQQPPMGPDGQQLTPMQQQGQPQEANPPQTIGGGASPMNIGVAQAGGTGINLQSVAEAKAQEIAQLQGVEEYKAMTQLRNEDPGMYDLVVLYKNKYKPRGSTMAPMPGMTGPGEGDKKGKKGS